MNKNGGYKDSRDVLLGRSRYSLQPFPEIDTEASPEMEPELQNPNEEKDLYFFSR